MDQPVGSAGIPMTEGLSGLSLSSFLQLLAQEGKSCVLRLRTAEHLGWIHLWEGALVDAETQDGLLGLPAIYTMFGWQDPVMLVEAPVDRMRRIDLPLTRLLLEAARHHDERSEYGDLAMPLDPSGTPPPSRLSRLISVLQKHRGIIHYYLLDRRGHVLEQSSRNRKVADLMTFCIVNAGQAAQMLDVKGPHRITLQFDQGDSLLIFPGAGGIIGLHLAAGLPPAEVLDSLRPLLASPLFPGPTS